MPAHPDSSVVRIAAVGDLHCGKDGKGTLQPLFSQMAQASDVMALCGDLTDHGLPEEARLLAEEISGAEKRPTVAVLGNHDFESGKHEEIKKILTAAGVHVLDGDIFEQRGVGFTGVKGYIGGFGSHALQSWGEVGIKRVVHESVEEALKLESALARLRTDLRVVLMHYSPISATVQGEPPEIIPFLGSSRLEEPINRYPVAAVFHGHAHHGRPEGKTRNGSPVYNVAMALLREQAPAHPPFRLLKLSTPRKAAAAQGNG